MEALARHRSHSVEFKRQVAREVLAGETLHGSSKRHDIARNLIRIRAEKYEAGAFDEDAQAADLIQAYEAWIAVLERLVGNQVPELEFLQRAHRRGPRPTSAHMSVIAGPSASPSRRDVAEQFPVFIETYNARRLHSSLGYLSPEQHETQLAQSPVKGTA